MLLRSTSLIYSGIHLVTLGATARYLVSSDDGSYVITNPGSSAHAEVLPKRLAGLDIPPERIAKVLITSLDAQKVGGIARIRQLCPKVKVVAAKSLYGQLTDEAALRPVWEQDTQLSGEFSQDSTSSFDDFKNAVRPDVILKDSQALELSSDTRIKCISTPGYQLGSSAYLVLPHGFLITDETFGFFRGRELPASGADASIQSALASLASFEHVEISGLGLPYAGALTGALVRRHIESIAQNLRDIAEQSGEGLREGLSHAEVKEQIREAFYSPLPEDNFLANAMKRSFEALCQQVLSK
jgi:glyoxylase-like metal-dependent hydrolase (beta-lactamase superfamily II)